MHTLIVRRIQSDILSRLQEMPVVAIIGPRQCGKTTLAKNIQSLFPESLYLDLELYSDLAKLEDSETFFELNSEKLICLDEIQLKPEIFTLIRAMVDKNGKNGRFLILGSASPELLRQTSETLAGRISYFELPVLSLEELALENENKLFDLWIRGGFPRSLLSKTDHESFLWRIDFIRSYLERDIPLFTKRIPSEQIRRLWMMCAHLHGSILNSSQIGNSLGISHPTIRSYLDILQYTFMIRLLQPYYTNVSKRIIKSPKIIFRDSGIMHALINIETMNDLSGHPSYGSSWEGFVIEQLTASLPEFTPMFYRTSNGNEIDCLLEKGNRLIAVECKASRSPKITQSFRIAVSDLGIKEAYVAAPVEQSFPIGKNVVVASPLEIVKTIRSKPDL